MLAVEVCRRIDGGAVLDAAVFGQHVWHELMEFFKESVPFSGLDLNLSNHVKHGGVEGRGSEYQGCPAGKLCIEGNQDRRISKSVNQGNLCEIILSVPSIPHASFGSLLTLAGTGNYPGGQL